MKSISHHEQLAREAKGEGCEHMARLVWNNALGGYREVATCQDCSVFVPLGPASDTAEVLVEIRAAELAYVGGPFNLPVYNRWENAGWERHYDGREMHDDDGARAGWLAREIWSHPTHAILNHDAEQAETGGEG